MFVTLKLAMNMKGVIGFPSWMLLQSAKYVIIADPNEVSGFSNDLSVPLHQLTWFVKCKYTLEKQREIHAREVHLRRLLYHSRVESCRPYCFVQRFEPFRRAANSGLCHRLSWRTGWNIFWVPDFVMRRPIYTISVYVLHRLRTVV